MLHLVGCLYYCIKDARSHKHQVLFCLCSHGVLLCRLIRILQKIGNVCKRNTEARSCNHCCRGEAVSITYSECVSVALVIQHAMLRAPYYIVTLACLTVPYFSTLSNKEQDFG